MLTWKLARDLMMAGLLLSTSMARALPKHDDLAALARPVQLIREAALRWEEGRLTPAVNNEDLPALDGDYAAYRAGGHLQFYQAASAFLRSQTPGVGARKRLALLQEAHRHITALPQSTRDLPFDLNNWKNAVSEKLASEYHAEGRHDDVLQLLGSGNAEPLSDAMIILYADSLRTSEQMTALRRLIMARPKLFTDALSRDPLRKHEALWRTMIDDSRRLLQEASERNSKRPSEASVTPVAAKEPTMTGQWLALQKEIKKAFYADYAATFAPLLDYYAIHLDDAKKEKRVAAYIKAFDRHLKDLPPPLLQRYIKRMWDKKKLELAVRASDIFLKNYRGHPSYPIVAYDKARLLEDAGKYARAYQELESMDKMIMGSQHEESFLFRRAWLAYLSNNMTDAKRHFDAYIAAYPNNNFTNVSRYYRLKAVKAEAKGDATKLAALQAEAVAFVERYPLSFYSLKLINEWQLPTSMVLSKLQPRPKPLDSYVKDHPYFKMDIEEQKLFGLYEELQALQLKDEAQKVLTRIDYKMGGQPEWVGLVINEAKEQKNANLLTVNSLKVLQDHPELQTYVSWHELYPRFREKEINHILETSHSPLPYEFVVALIRQESAFNHKAVSAAKAKGLMQIMPSTASILIKAFKRNTFDLFNPDENLELGIHMLNRLHKKYSGRLDYVLSAYNAGDTVTDRWVAMRGKLPQDEFIESIPYGETREYIKLIFRNMEFYKLVYNQDRA